MKKMIWAVVALLGFAAWADFNTALDCNELTFTTGGDADWYEQTDVVKIGTSALRSGAITDNQETWIETTVTNVGLLSFWWKASSESGYDWLEVSVDGEQKVTIDGTGLGWVQKSVIITGDGEHTVKWRYRKDNSMSEGEDCAWLDGVELTSVPETVKLHFNTLCDAKVDSIDVPAGDDFPASDLPVPTYKDWIFEGWYMIDEYGAELVEEVVPISFHDMTLVALWQLPVSALDADGLAFSASAGWEAANNQWPWWTSPPDANLAIYGFFQGTEELVDESYVPQSQKQTLTATVEGPSIVSFDMFFSCNNDWYNLVRKGKATLTVSFDGKKLNTWSETKSDEIKISVPAGTHTFSVELSGTPGVYESAWWSEYDAEAGKTVDHTEYSLLSPVVTISDIKRFSTKPRASFGEWLQAIRDGGWIPGDLQRFTKEYEARIATNPADYEAHLMRAATILAALAESKTVADYAKKFGFTLDYLGMNVSGSWTKPSSWPAVNATVDQFVKEAVPVIKDALADLEAIPADWTGTVLLSADEYPVDEDTYVDIGDVLYARAGLEASVGLAYFAHSYDLTVDYAKADKARSSGDSAAFKFLTEQTKFAAKVRNASSLSLSKSWMATAFDRALLADAAVLARKDDFMHFIEYDLVSDGDLIDKARNLTQKALASLDAPQGIDVQEEVFGERAAPFDVTLLPVGDDGLLQVYLGALFEGKITRNLQPTFQKGADGNPVPVMETIKDPTIGGLLPDFTVRDWTRLLLNIGRAVSHQTITVKFDGNGGQVKPNALSFDYDDEKEGCFYPELPVPADRKGYLFVGWATAKTGGTKVRAGDEYDAAPFANAKTPTLYAQWLKLVKVTLKDSSTSAQWELPDDCDPELIDWIFLGNPALYGGGSLNGKGTMELVPGAKVSVTAESFIVDKNKNLSFQKWTVSPATADLGRDFQVSSSTTDFTMPTVDVSLAATYIDAATTAELIAVAEASPVTIGWDDEAGQPLLTIEPPYEAFEWSPDGGKTWYKSGTAALLKAGSYAVSWRSTDPQWSAPATSKTKTKLEVGDYKAFEGDTTFAYIPQVVVDVVTCEGGKALDSSAGGTVTLNPKDGLVPLGKSITLTAKATKNYVFQGWSYYRDSNNWEYGNDFGSTVSATKIENNNACCCGLSCGGMLDHQIDPADGKVHVKAVFKALSDYRADDIVFAGVYGNTETEVEYDGSGNATVDLYGRVGCLFGGEEGYSVDCVPKAYPLAFKLAKGAKLPAGLKFDAKTGVFSGVPTKAEDADVSIVAVDPAKNEKSLAVRIHIRALPEWLVGDYRALTREDVPNGLVEISVTTAGKVSAKYTTRGGTVSFSGNIAWLPDEKDAEADGQFYFSKEDKNGWADVEFGADGSVSGELEMSFKIGTEEDYVHGEASGLRQNKDLLTKSNFLEKYYTFKFGREIDGAMDSGYGYLTVKTDKKGGAKVTGQLPDGEKVSMSALVMPFYATDESTSEETLNARLYLFASPSAYKKLDWFAMALTIDPDGMIVSEDGAAWTPPNARADKICCGMIVAPVNVQVSGYGALYSEAKDLEGYYWNIVCGYSEDVAADYVNKKGDVLEYPVAESFGDDDPTFFDVSLKGTAKGEIVLRAKSPAPWNDGKKWHFDVDKKGAAITDPSQLSFTFAKATGIFSGKATAYFGYDDVNTGKTVLKTAPLPFNGVVVNTPIDESVVREGFGAAIYSGKSFEKDAKTGKWKEFKFAVSLPVSLKAVTVDEP